MKVSRLKFYEGNILAVDVFYADCENRLKLKFQKGFHLLNILPQNKIQNVLTEVMKFKIFGLCNVFNDFLNRAMLNS